MRKIWILLLVLALLVLAGCNEQTPVQTNPTESVPVEPSTEPVDTTPAETDPPVPQTESATVKAENTPAILLKLDRGTVVELVGDFDEQYAIAKVGELFGLVEKTLLRTAEQAPYESWTGYAYANSPVFDNLRRQGEAVQTLAKNTQVEVLEDLGFGYLVKLDEQLLFMASDSLSKTPIKNYTGGGGGGADGGDIELNNPWIGQLAAIPQEGTVIGEATVLADGTELILAHLSLGETVQIVTEEGFAEPMEGYATVYMDGLFAYVQEFLVRTGSEEGYTAWDGYAAHKAVVYKDLYMLDPDVTKPAVNTVLHVIDELEGCYVVELDGKVGYIAKDLVSKEKVHVSTGGGGGGGGEWTPPAM